MIPKPAKDTPFTRLFAIPILEWEREGTQAYERARARLLDSVAQVLETMQNEQNEAQTLKTLILAGQSALLEDIAIIRPDLVALLAIFNAGGRLGVGPQMVWLEGALALGETHLRNWLYGLLDAQRHGMKALKVALLPFYSAQFAQLPQVLQGFGMDAVLIMSDVPFAPFPFTWHAPNGSQILVAPHLPQTTPQDAIQEQRRAQPDGPFLWLAPIDAEGKASLPPTMLDDIPSQQSTLTEYVSALRASLPDVLRPALKGELSLSDDWRGRWSGRLHLKQASARHQHHLIYHVERWLTIALTQGKGRHPANRRALLDYAWHLLLSNQTPAALGVGVDAVEDDAQQRNQRLETISHDLLSEAQALLSAPNKRATSDSLRKTDEYWLVVWNPHLHNATQVVELALNLPEGQHPANLYDHEGAEVAFAWRSPRIAFCASAPSVGYRVYRLVTSSSPSSADFARPQLTRGRMISDGGMSTLDLDGGRLTWTTERSRIVDLLYFDDGGDAGDLQSYRAPQQDVLVRAATVDVVDVETTPIYERLIFKNRMRVAPELEGDKRGRGLRVLELTTHATLYFQMGGLHLHTNFINTARDHRLRAHIATNKRADQLQVDNGFSLITRGLNHPQLPARPSAHAAQSLALVSDEESSFAVLTRGLPELEARQQDGRLWLALTLARSVAWLDKSKGISALRAQAERVSDVEFALHDIPTDEQGISHMEAGQAIRLAQLYNAPLRATQMSLPPAQLERSFLSVDEPRLLLSALKPPQQGEGWVLRLVNPTGETLNSQINTSYKLAQARKLNMAEQLQASLSLNDGTLSVSLAPYQVLTLGLEFAP